MKRIAIKNCGASVVGDVLRVVRKFATKKWGSKFQLSSSIHRVSRRGRNMFDLSKFFVVVLPIIPYLLAGCGSGDSGANVTDPVGGSPPAFPVSRGVWVVMGSSTAAGAGASPGNRWSDLLEKKLLTRGAKVENLARGGSVTYQGLSVTAARVANRPAPNPEANVDQALARNPTVLLLAYPTNDTASGYTVDETVRNILAIRSAAQAKQVSVLVLSTQPRNLPTAGVEQLKEIDARLSAVVGTCFVNVYPLLSDSADRLASTYNSGDGIHPNDAGHRVIADAVLTTVDGGSCLPGRNG